MFWIPLASAILNVVFLLDFIVIAFTGSGLADHLFGTGEQSSLVAAVTSYIPGMAPFEFFLANGIVLGFVCMLMLASIYIAFYSDRRQCYTGAGCGR